MIHSNLLDGLRGEDAEAVCRVRGEPRHADRTGHCAIHAVIAPVLRLGRPMRRRQ